MIGSCSVWVTGKCRLGCPYCYLRKSNQVDMTDETLEATANWINMNRVGTVDFFGGEPFENPSGIKKIIALTRTPRFGVTTNGILLDEGLYEWLRLFKFGINLSLDGTKEAQDKYRNNSYSPIIGNLDKWLSLNVNVTKTLLEPSNLYDNVLHIKDLGFRNCFINGLKPYGQGYIGGLGDLEEQYRKVIKELHDPPEFSLGDFVKLKEVSERWQKSTSRGCGINRKGYAIGPRGFIYPCHAAVDMGNEFTIGSVFNGIDPIREMNVRSKVSVIPEKCRECDLGCLPCPVACYSVHGELGLDPDDWYCDATKIRISVVNKLTRKPFKATPMRARMDT